LLGKQLWQDRNPYQLTVEPGGFTSLDYHQGSHYPNGQDRKNAEKVFHSQYYRRRESGTSLSVVQNKGF
jgi:hypothetical protein